MRADRECSSPPRKRGREEVTCICPFVPAFAGMARSYCGRSRARIAATDGQAAAADERAPRAATLGLRTENRRSPLTTHAIRGSRPEEALDRCARGADL